MGFTLIAWLAMTTSWLMLHLSVRVPRALLAGFSRVTRVLLASHLHVTREFPASTRYLVGELYRT